MEHMITLQESQTCITDNISFNTQIHAKNNNKLIHKITISSYIQHIHAILINININNTQHVMNIEMVLIFLWRTTNCVQTFEPPSLRPRYSSLLVVGHPQGGTKLHRVRDS